jgi:hypothetical protein
MSTASARATSRRAAARDDGRPAVWVWAAGLLALVLLALLVAWLAGWIRFTTDPRVTEIIALQEQAREQFGGSGPSSLADATAMATSMMEIRQKMEALPEHLRPQVERAGRSVFQAAFQARIEAYFALPPEQRQAEVDRQIDQEEMMRKVFEAGRTVAGALGGPQPASTASARPPQPGGSRSEEERNRWRKSMIDRTTPQERARYTEWRRAMDARREQRGLPSGWPR